MLFKGGHFPLHLKCQETHNKIQARYRHVVMICVLLSACLCVFTWVWWLSMCLCRVELEEFDLLWLSSSSDPEHTISQALFSTNCKSSHTQTHTVVDNLSWAFMVYCKQSLARAKKNDKWYLIIHSFLFLRPLHCVALILWNPSYRRAFISGMLKISLSV